MASTYVTKAISGNAVNHGEVIILEEPNDYQKLDIGFEVDLPETMNSRVDNRGYYNDATAAQ